jgi:hypothetical protein
LQEDIHMIDSATLAQRFQQMKLLEPLKRKSKQTTNFMLAPIGSRGRIPKFKPDNGGNPCPHHT